MKEIVLRSFLALLLMSALSVAGYAQGGAASSLSGVVIDSSGGVVPGAEVKVKNDATGAEYSTVTAENGTFSIPALSSGTYTATVSMASFKQSIVKDIQIIAGVPQTIRVTLQVGGTNETVVVQGGAEMVQSQTANVTTTLVLRQVANLPLATRNAMDFLVFLPGVTTTGAARNSTVAGVPGAAVNVTIDGVNTQDNSNKSGDSFFSMIQPRLDAIEEVTVSMAASGADSSGQGAVQIKFVTRSGNNDYHGSLYWYHRNPVLNSNYWFNNRNLQPTYDGTRTPCTPQQLASEWDKCKAPRDRILFNQPGGRIGGPIVLPKSIFGPLGFNGRDKAFFFLNYEEYRLPSEATRTRTIFNPLIDQGTFPYTVGSGVSLVNLLSLASSKGQTSTMDPTVQKLLSDIRQSTSKGSVVARPDPAYMDFSFTNKALDLRKFITSRFDFNLTSKHRLEGSWNYSIYDLTIDLLNSGDASYPDFPSVNGYLGLRHSTSIALRSTLSPRLVNEFRTGLQAGSGLFGPGVDASMFSGTLANQDGYALALSDAGITNVYRSSSPSRRDPPYVLFEDTINWMRGPHSFSFGGTFSNTGMWTFSQTVVPSIGFGVDTTFDPARILFDSVNGPVNFQGASNTQISTARDIYGVLTGRVDSIGGSAVLNEITNKYAFNGPNVTRSHQRELGLFAQDSWRMHPGLTVTLGLRYELQLPFVPLNDVFSKASLADVWGPSGFNSLFKPGATGGKQTEYTPYKKGDHAYNIDYKAFAPSVGFAWTPKVGSGWLERLLGSGQTVLRGGFSVAYNRYGMFTYSNIFTSNPGLTLTASRNMSLGNLVSNTGTDVLPVLFRDKSRLGPPPFPSQPNYPLLPTTSDSVRSFDPDLKTPYTMTWSFGIQRELSKDMAIEVRYMATRSLQSYSTYNLNERNIVENGLLNEFKLAMANLQANIAAGKGNTFKYYGPGTNTSPLPISLAYFSGYSSSQAGDATKYTSSNFSSSTYVNTLALTNPNPSSYAGSLYGSAAQRANALAAGLPANLFVVNPSVSSAQILGNGGFNQYDGMTVELRRRMSKGLLVQANYTFAKSLGISSSSFRQPWIKSLGGTLPHAFKLNWVYELPFGKGRAVFANTTGVIDRIIGGWEFQGTGRLQAGELLNFGNVRLVGMTLNDLKDAVGLYFDDVNRQIYYVPNDIRTNTIAAFNTSATTSTGYSTSFGVPTGRYVAPASTANCIQIVSGDCAPYTNYVRGPIFTRFDLSLVKRVRFTETKNFELRAEFLNAFNYTNFYGTTCASSSQTCGRVSSAYSDRNGQVDPGGRLVQFVVRLNF
ncbi:MAG: carboxypeptidase-like regulatory domain-containing protein [Acidobacteriia bacterium]|nr:carboxypeptidase-like regulatory domain-containing protein [Terriglobia bacterium]